MLPVCCCSVGGDVDPDLYGHRDDVPNLYGVDRGCDERTLALIKTAVDTGRPLLGVCRSSQLINVAFGGTLIPDLGPENLHRGHGEDPMFLDDTILVEEGTRLAGNVGAQRLTVRNGHHQAVGDVAPDLTVAARGVDGVVEAVEHRDTHCWVFGVQWHPEDSDGPPRLATRCSAPCLSRPPPTSEPAGPRGHRRLAGPAVPTGAVLIAGAEHTGRTILWRTPSSSQIRRPTCPAASW